MKTYILYIIGLMVLIVCLVVSIYARLIWPSIALCVALLWLCVSMYGRIDRLRYAYHETEKENEKLQARLVDGERQLQYLRQLTENVDTALFVCSTDGRIDWMNHAAKVMTPENSLPSSILQAIADLKERLANGEFHLNQDETAAASYQLNQQDSDLQKEVQDIPEMIL